MLELVRHERPEGARSVSEDAPQGAQGRYVSVTRTGSLTSETKQPQPLPPAPFFVDWVSASQVHTEGGLPVVDAGCVMSLSTDGELEWKTGRSLKHEGSFETSCNVKSDGYRVSFSGNVSRFGRADNLFGFDIFRCVSIINHILSHYGLPPFTAGSKHARITRGNVVYEWTGARFSRLDLTANYQSGSPENAHSVLQFLGSQHAQRHEGRILGQGETVAFGAGSKRQYWKAYIKHLELLRHGCSDPRIIEYCSNNGIVRFEGTLRSRTLTDLGAAFLGDFESGWAMGQLIKLFEEKSSILSRAEKSTDDLNDLPRHLRGTARNYLAGDDLAREMPRASFYRHRKELLPYGIDIAVRNVRPFQPRVKVIELKPAQVPSWYQLVA